MKIEYLIALLLSGIASCNETNSIRLSEEDKSKTISNFELRLKEITDTCLPNGERLVRVPEQIEKNSNYFACAKNSWECVPVTVYERTGEGPKKVFVFNEDGYLTEDHGNLTIYSRGDNYVKCVPPRQF